MNIAFTPSSLTETAGSGNSTHGSATGNKFGSTTGPCTGTNAGCCKPGVSCVACTNCVNFSNGYGSLCYNGATNCKLNSTLVTKLNNANLASVNAEVSEAWPPTMSHRSLCHQDGTCADVRCKNQCKNETVANIKKIYDKIKAAGLNPIFENNDCDKYTAAGISCYSYSTMTSPSFHVNM